MSAQNIATSIYEGSATLGKVQSYVGLFIFGFISIILVVIAIYLFTINESNLADTQGIILHSICNKIEGTGGNNMSYSCNLQVKYVVNEKEYIGNITINSSAQYYPGTFIDITYDSNNPNHVTEKKLRDKTIAFILLGIAILLGGGAYANYYMTTHSQAYAALEGASTAIRII